MQMPDPDTVEKAARSLFWSHLAFELTIAARETYVPQTEDVAEPSKLRACNEILHRVCSHIAALQRAQETFSDDQLFEFCFEIGNRAGIASSLRRAIERAMIGSGQKGN